MQGKTPLKTLKILSIIASVVSFITFVVFKIGYWILNESLAEFSENIKSNVSVADFTQFALENPGDAEVMANLFKMRDICRLSIIPLICCVIFVFVAIIIHRYLKNPNGVIKFLNGLYNVLCIVIAIIYFIYCAICTVAVTMAHLFSGLDSTISESNTLLYILIIVFLIGGILLLPFVKRIIDKRIYNKTQKIILYLTRILILPIVAVITGLINNFLL